MYIYYSLATRNVNDIGLDDAVLTSAIDMGFEFKKLHVECDMDLLIESSSNTLMMKTIHNYISRYSNVLRHESETCRSWSHGPSAPLVAGEIL